METKYSKIIHINRTSRILLLTILTQGYCTPIEREKLAKEFDLFTNSIIWKEKKFYSTEK